MRHGRATVFLATHLLLSALVASSLHSDTALVFVFEAIRSTLGASLGRLILHAITERGIEGSFPPMASSSAVDWGATLMRAGRRGRREPESRARRRHWSALCSGRGSLQRVHQARLRRSSICPTLAAKSAADLAGGDIEDTNLCWILVWRGIAQLARAKSACNQPPWCADWVVFAVYRTLTI
jgi:hypothetical protein